jgi:hypothetical protein
MVLVRTLVKLAVKYGMPKIQIVEIISEEFDRERDNARSPQ